jgi:hypothetical protein
VPPYQPPNSGTDSRRNCGRCAAARLAPPPPGSTAGHVCPHPAHRHSPCCVEVLLAPQICCGSTGYVRWRDCCWPAAACCCRQQRQMRRQLITKASWGRSGACMQSGMPSACHTTRCSASCCLCPPAEAIMRSLRQAVLGMDPAWCASWGGWAPDSDTHHCSWGHVACDDQGHVTSM